MKKFTSCNNIIHKKNNKNIKLILILISNSRLIKYYYLKLLIEKYENKYIIYQPDKNKNIIKNIIKYLYINLKRIIFIIDITDIIEFDENIKIGELNLYDIKDKINIFNNIIYNFKKKIKDDIKYIIDNGH